MTTLEALRSLAERELDVDPTALDPNIALAALGVDSLAIADLIFKVEDQFHVTIEMRELDPQLTLADFADKIDAELAKKLGAAAAGA